MKSRDDVLARFRVLIEQLDHGYGGGPLPGEAAKKAECRALAWVLNKEIPHCARG